MQPTTASSGSGNFFQNKGANNHNQGDIKSSEIICRGLSKQFVNEPSPAVDQVSFKAAAGDLVVLLGPSGCGKTTLLKMINRLYEPSGGDIFIGGQDVRQLNKNELRRQIGYVIQQVGLFPHMTIAKNIAIVPHLLGWEQKRIDERVAYLLEMVGLKPSYLTHYPRQLSGGEQQRVGLARALAADPSILLMDEPFAAVDAINRERLQQELLEIHRKLGKTILFVTHDVEEAFCLADKIIILKSGKLVQYGTPLEIVTKPQNEFVEELVGAGNLLRKLSLLDVQSVLATHSTISMSDANQKEIKSLPVVHPQEDLRSALALMLASGGERLQVNDLNDKPIGEVSFSDLQAILKSNLSKNLNEV